MYTVYICHFRFHFSICQTSLPLRLLHCWPRTDKYCNDLQGKFFFSFSGLKGGWRVPYERLGRLASIQNTIPKTSSHQCSFWEETAHYFGVGMGWLWFWPPVFWAELVQHFFLVRPDNKLDEQTSQKLPKVVVWGSAKTCRNSPRPGEITTSPILKTLNFIDPLIFWNILSMGTIFSWKWIWRENHGCQSWMNMEFTMNNQIRCCSTSMIRQKVVLFPKNPSVPKTWHSGNGRTRKSNTSHFVFLSSWFSPANHSATQKKNCIRLVARSFPICPNHILVDAFFSPTNGQICSSQMESNHLPFRIREKNTLKHHLASPLKRKKQIQLKSLKPAPSIIKESKIYVYCIHMSF